MESGYRTLFRFNPELEADGKNPFKIDSKTPDFSKFKEFIPGEVRFDALRKNFPETAEAMFEMAEKDAKWRYNYYKRLSEMDF